MRPRNRRLTGELAINIEKERHHRRDLERGLPDQEETGQAQLWRHARDANEEGQSSRNGKRS